MHHRKQWLLAFAAGLSIWLSVSACATEEDPEPTEETERATAALVEGPRAPVSFTATEYEYDGPDSFPAGLTEVVFANEGTQSHSLVFAQLDEGRTVDDVLDLMQAEGPFPDWVTFAGGIGGIAPGESASMIHEFEPGPHVVFSFEISEGEEESDAQKGMIQEVEVTEADGTAADEPEADVTVDMLDYSFDMSGEPAAGSQTIQVTNGGGEPHEALIMRLTGDVTGAEVAAMIAQFAEGGPPEDDATVDDDENGTPDSEDPDDADDDGTDTADADETDDADDADDDDTGTPDADETDDVDATDDADATDDDADDSGTPGATAEDSAAGGPPPDGPPFASAGGLAPLDPGETAWLTMDFQPGRYVILCFVPDTQNGTMHLALGMWREFTIQ